MSKSGQASPPSGTTWSVRLRNAGVEALSAPVRAYRYAISPMTAPTCRFHPSCSVYALEALRLHGPLRGLAMTVARIGRCHPFHPGGFDPVPLPHEHGPGGLVADDPLCPTTNQREPADAP
jgi:putative membrane protein insertion efficiency factor